MVKYKSIWGSKTFWAVVGLLFVAIWNATAPHFRLPTFPNEVYPALAALGGWGIRTANSTLILPGQNVPPQAPAPDNVVPSPVPTEPAPVPPPQVDPVPAETADPTPAPTPAPVQAAPAPGDPDMLNLMTLLTAALSTGSTPPAAGQLPALASWVDTWGPKFKADVLALGAGLTPAGVLALAADVIPAANALAATFAGADRAEVVAVTVRYVVQTFAPPIVQPILAPILASGALENLIEAEYRRLFPPQVTAPVVNAPELPSGAAVTQ